MKRRQWKYVQEIAVCLEILTFCWLADMGRKKKAMEIRTGDSCLLVNIDILRVAIHGTCSTRGNTVWGMSEKAGTRDLQALDVSFRDPSDWLQTLKALK